MILDLPPAENQASTAVDRGIAGSRQDTVRGPLPIEQVYDPDSVLALLPTAADGAIDWSAAVRQGVIDPLPLAPASGSTAAGFGYDFYFGEFETYFPHSSHNRWLTCESCHPDIVRSRGAKTSMKAIGEGESCGVCHNGRGAFATQPCERCHRQITLPEGRLTPDLGATIRIARDSSLEQSFPPSVFSHWFHRVRNRCSACHNDTFEMTAGAASMTMATIQSGEGCGRCHDGTRAFGLMECARCHQPVEAGAN